MSSSLGSRHHSPYGAAGLAKSDISQQCNPGEYRADLLSWWRDGVRMPHVATVDYMEYIKRGMISDASVANNSRL